MQTVSENWKNTHKQTLLNESFVEVSIDITDPKALADISSKDDGAVDNGAVYISDTTQVVREVDVIPAPYCTLEQNLWLLDGSLKAIPPTNYGLNGYIGDVLSDDKCVFSSKAPVITLKFSKEFMEERVPGITITWSSTYGEFADSFIVTAYDIRGVIAAQKEVTGNRSIKSEVRMNLIGYKRIEITILKWCLPYHRARVEEIFVGIRKVFSKTDLFGYSHSQSVSPVSTALPKNEIKFTIDNTRGEYNPYNEDGWAKYFMEHQEVKTRYGLKLNDGTIEWIKGGTFYLSEWYAKQNGISAEFAARDLMGIMSDIYWDESPELKTWSLYSLAEKVLEKANLPLNNDGTPKWVIHSSLATINVAAPVPEDTLANILQLIANAGRCVLYQDRKGIIHIEPWEHQETDYKINSFNSYSKTEIATTTKSRIAKVETKIYHYSTGENGIESTVTSDYLIMGGKGESIVIDNPLITSAEQASLVRNWMYSILSNKITLESTWRADVRLDALDIVTNENNYNTKRVGMTDVEFTYNGAFRAKGEGMVMKDG